MNGKRTFQIYVAIAAFISVLWTALAAMIMTVIGAQVAIEVYLVFALIVFCLTMLFMALCNAAA